MKFGKILQQSIQLSSTEWESLWFDYKLLKRIIKDCAQIPKHDKLKKEKLILNKLQPIDNDTIRESKHEMHFFRTLRQEISKITDFFAKEQQRYYHLVQKIETQYQQLNANFNKTNNDNHATNHAQEVGTQNTTTLLASIVSLFKELLLLENYAVINYCGISKILKKHDKWTGYSTRSKFVQTVLAKQPFATYSPLLAMINRIEHIYIEATGCAIDQHDKGNQATTATATTTATTSTINTAANSNEANPSISCMNHEDTTISSNSVKSANNATTTTLNLTPQTGQILPSLNYDVSADSHASSSNTGDDNGAVNETVENSESTSQSMEPTSTKNINNVTLHEVHALRDDAKQFKRTEDSDLSPSSSPYHSEVDDHFDLSKCDDNTTDNNDNCNSALAVQKIANSHTENSVDCVKKSDKNGKSKVVFPTNRSSNNNHTNNSMTSTKRPLTCNSTADGGNDDEENIAKRKMSFATILN